MFVTTTKMTAEHYSDGVVVPLGATGEIIGDGWTDENGTEWLAVDFGNVVGDFRVEDLKVVSPA